MVHPVERGLGCTVPMVVGLGTNDGVQQADQHRLVDGLVRCDEAPNFLQEGCVFHFEGFTNGLPSYLRRFCPRKSNPSLTCAMMVLSRESVSPRSFKNCSTKGRTSLSNNSCELPVMMKSSAYRTRLTLGAQRWRFFHPCRGEVCRQQCFQSVQGQVNRQACLPPSDSVARSAAVKVTEQQLAQTQSAQLPPTAARHRWFSGRDSLTGVGRMRAEMLGDEGFNVNPRLGLGHFGQTARQGEPAII